VQKFAAAVTAAAVLCGASGFAFAAPPTPMTYSWTGFYYGASAGGNWFSDSTSPTVTGTPGNNASRVQAAIAATKFGAGASGIFGLHVGYNWQLNQSGLAGLEADLSVGQFDGASQTNVITGPAGHTITSTFNRDILPFGTVRGRAGVLVTPEILAYGTGGLAYGQTHASYSVSSPDAGGSPVSVVASNSRLQAGWSAGGGIEYGFQPGWRFKIEYLHFDLGSQRLTAANPSPPANVKVNFISAVNPSFAGDLLRVGFSHSF
jgi:outer membrane immunogenic protein